MYRLNIDLFVLLGLLVWGFCIEDWELCGILGVGVLCLGFCCGFWECL